MKGLQKKKKIMKDLKQSSKHCRWRDLKFCMNIVCNLYCSDLYLILSNEGGLTKTFLAS